MKSTRTIQIGEKTVVVKNVPEGISDIELRKATLMKLLEMGLSQEKCAS